MDRHLQATAEKGVEVRGLRSTDLRRAADQGHADVLQQQILTVEPVRPGVAVAERRPARLVTLGELLEGRPCPVVGTAIGSPSAVPSCSAQVPARSASDTATGASSGPADGGDHIQAPSGEGVDRHAAGGVDTAHDDESLTGLAIARPGVGGAPGRARGAGSTSRPGRRRPTLDRRERTAQRLHRPTAGAPGRGAGKWAPRARRGSSTPPSGTVRP